MALLTAAPRLHHDAEAAAVARTNGARAVTIGSDVYFGAGEWAPGTARGDWLIAHETAHVGQQSAPFSEAQPAPVEAEALASAYADAVISGQALPPVGRAPWGAGQCQPKDPPATAPWNINGLSIDITSPKGDPGDSWGFVMPGVRRPFSKDGQIRSFCVTPARYPLQLLFHVDADIIPRPQPFTPPKVSASLSFRPGGGGAPPSPVHAVDAKPIYEGPGHPLRTTFGRVIGIDSGAGGTLTVAATLQDPDSQTTLRYSDEITCRLDPCA